MRGYDLRPLFSLHRKRADSDDRQENYLRTEKTMKLTGRDGITHYKVIYHNYNVTVKAFFKQQAREVSDAYHHENPSK